MDQRFILVEQARREYWLRQAGKRRLVRQALAARPARDRFRCRSLMWLGQRFVALGLRLQAYALRYSAAPARLRLSITPGEPASERGNTCAMHLP